MRLGRRGVGLLVKKAARLAGLGEWKYVTPHCLRKSFDSEEKLGEHHREEHTESP
jgi:site-specific recombinase XerD